MSTTEPPREEPGGTRPELLEIGRIAKPHGLSGEVVVDLVTNRKERLEPGTVLWASDGSQLVVESSKPFGSRWIVIFDRIGDRGAAERMRGVTLEAEPIEEEGAMWVDELVGSGVVDQTGRDLGKIKALVANPASDLLELESGALIPLAFVVDQSGGRISVDIPDGLID